MLQAARKAMVEIINSLPIPYMNIDRYFKKHSFDDSNPELILGSFKRHGETLRIVKFQDECQDLKCTSKIVLQKLIQTR